jgi:predicted amidohydrolase YtcJ
MDPPMRTIASRSCLPATLSLLAALAACESGPPVEPADMVLHNGRVVTVDDSLPEAQAVAVRGYQILAVGSNDEIDRYIGPGTEVIDLAGRLMIPGFIESHGHYMSLGQSKMILDLTTAKNFDDIVASVQGAVAQAKPGDWIFGRGWHQEKWDKVPEPNVEGVPLHAALDSVSPENPVVLTHASGHASFVNGAALAAAGVDARTRNPNGGEIVRDASGNPTGLLRETAQGLARRGQGRGSEQRSAEEVYSEQKRQVDRAGQEALENGVTSFTDAGSGFATIDFLKSLEDRNELPVRLYVMVRNESPENLEAHLDEYRMIDEGNDYLTVRSIKQSIDGALGPHGAWLLEPYADMPESAGLETTPVARIEEIARIAYAHNFGMNIHAIGDRANREVLDIYEKIFNEGTGGMDRRWRIEHAQHLGPQDIPRFAALGVIAAMQGIHCTSDGPWVLKRLGPERAESGAYMWRDLIDSGAIISNGTDVPVERIGPIASYYASVTRIMPDGTPFYPAQNMTRAEALRTYTLNGAYAAFEEDVKGSIKVGKYADFTVLDRDILTIPDAEIPDTKVDLTIIGGVVKYQREM